MAGLGIRVYLDENLDVRVADMLCQQGYDALHALRVGNVRLPDEQHLRFATGLGRAVATHNFADFARLHVDFLRQGEHHEGIVLIPVRSLTEVVSRLSKHLDSYTSAEQRDALLWA